MKKFEQTLLGSANTIKTQKCLYERHLKPYLPKDYHDSLLLELFETWTGDDLGPGTIRGLTSLYKKYCRWKWKIDPDCSGIRYAVRALPQETKVKAWTKDEAGQALAKAEVEDPELYPMLLTTLHTGMRKGEMQALVWGDVDFISSKILIRQSKNGKPRTVPLTPQVEKVLMNCYTIGEEDEHCFPQYDPNDRLKHICRSAGIPVISWHGLRHTFATLALEAGRSPKRVSSILGHSKLSTTLDIYWQCTSEHFDTGFLP